MTLICPACRKANDKNDDACARCGCDLSALRTVVQAADRHLATASDFLRGARWKEALGCSERSWNLLHAPDAARLAFLCAAALGRASEAVRWHRRAAAPAATDSTLPRAASDQLTGNCFSGGN